MTGRKRRKMWALFDDDEILCQNYKPLIYTHRHAARINSVACYPGTTVRRVEVREIRRKK